MLITVLKYIYNLTEHDVETIKQIISPIQDFFSFGIDDMDKWQTYTKDTKGRFLCIVVAPRLGQA